MLLANSSGPFLPAASIWNCGCTVCVTFGRFFGLRGKGNGLKKAKELRGAMHVVARVGGWAAWIAAMAAMAAIGIDGRVAVWEHRGTGRLAIGEWDEMNVMDLMAGGWGCW